MSDKNIKAIRGQMRQLAKELLTQELAKGIQEQLAKAVNERLNSIDAYVKTQLGEMNERSKETQDYVTRKLALAEVRATTVVVDDSAKQTS